MRKRLGFTLVEVVVLMLIVSIMLTVMARLTVAARAAAVERSTPALLERLQEAIATFTLQTQRLPCPADGALPLSDPGAGVERRDGNGDCADAQARGVVPWRTLALHDDMQADAQFARITYRVAEGLTRNQEMLWADCDPAGGAGADQTGPASPHHRCRPGCSMVTIANCTNTTVILAGRGFAVRDKLITEAGSAIVVTGVAYLLISHGANRGGAYSPSGVLMEAIEATTPMDDRQRHNTAVDALKAYYVSPAGDDVMAYVSVIGAAQKGAVAPRVHVN